MTLEVSLMGTRGPVPKPSDKRLGHRAKAESDSISTVPAAVDVEIPEAEELWHPIAQRWFKSLAKSGQHVFFEPSDWAEACFIAEVMSRALISDKLSGPVVAAIQAGTSRLLATEGDRRRLRIELERASPIDADEEAAVTALDQYRRRLSS
jgi:hypothetical protein